MSDFKQRMDDAIQEAYRSPSGDLLSIAQRYLPDITDKGVAKVCPYCGKKGGKFFVRKAAGGHWYWGCYNTSCNAAYDNLKAGSGADTIGFIADREGCDRKRAVAILFEITGVTHPASKKEDEQ